MSTEPITQVGLAVLLQRVELAGHHQRAARVRQLGLHQADALALEQLVAFGALTPGELGRRLGLTSGGVTALTTRLEAAGWVARELHPHDRRMRVLSATPEGAERHAEQIAPVLEAADAVLSDLTGQESELVACLLERLWLAKQASAEATPDPPREHVDDGYTRALLM